MRKDYEAIKAEIGSVLGKVSGHYEMSEACFHLRAALSIVEQRQKKDQKRQAAASKSPWVVENGRVMTQKQAQAALSEIEKMIAAESKKIGSLEASGEDSENQTLID